MKAGNRWLKKAVQRMYTFGMVPKGKRILELEKELSALTGKKVKMKSNNVCLPCGNTASCIMQLIDKGVIPFELFQALAVHTLDKHGLDSYEIAALLKISPMSVARTIAWHRHGHPHSADYAPLTAGHRNPPA